MTADATDPFHHTRVNHAKPNFHLELHTYCILLLWLFWLSVATPHELVGARSLHKNTSIYKQSIQDLKSKTEEFSNRKYLSHSEFADVFSLGDEP